jgi:hypothetical protein
MSDVATLGLRIDADGFVSGARRAETAAGSLTNATERLEGAMSKFRTVFGLGLFGFEFLKETVDAQSKMAQLEAAVRSTGGAAGQTVKELDDLSQALQRTTTYSDEAVKGAESLLLTFDKIKGVQFAQATKAVADLAARMGGDLQGAAVQVGKALQDPDTGLTALRRSGVSFSEQQIQVIKSLYDTGRAAEAQTIILKELEHEFGGSAAAARDTLGGALTGLKHAFGDLFEISRGSSGGLIGAINGLSTALGSLAGHDAELVVGIQLTAALFAGKWVSSFASARAAATEMYAQVLAGNAVMLDSTAAIRGRAAAAVEAAQLEVQGSARAIAILQAERTEIRALQVAERERLATAKARLAFAVPQEALGALGGAVQARDNAQVVAALQQRSVALENLTALQQRAVVSDAELAAANAQLVASENAVTAASIRQAEAIAATTIATRVASAASGLFSTALAAVGGPIGAAILAAVALNAALDHYLDNVTKAAELTDEQQAAYEKALKTERERNSAIKAAAEAAALEAAAIKKAVGERQLEIDKLQSLNGAYKQTDLNLQIIGIRYDERIKNAKDATEHTGKELAVLVGLNHELANQQVVAAELMQRKKDLADLDAYQAEQLDKIADGLKNTTTQYATNLTVLQSVVLTQKELNDLEKGAGEIGARNAKALHDAAAAAVKYADDMKEIWTKGIGKIVTDGTKSFRDFFEDVLRMFSNLMARMQQEGKTDGGLFKLLGLGSAAITGGFAGYQIGQQTGSSLGGVLGGGAAGALAGASIAGPLGAAVGGLTGAAAGLLGASNAQHDAATQLKEAAQALHQSVEAYAASALTGVEQQRAQVQAQYDGIRQALQNAFNTNTIDWKTYIHESQLASDTVAKLLERIAAAEETRQANAAQDYNIRTLTASAITTEQKNAAAMQALMLAQARELADAINSGDSPATIAALQAAQAAEKAAELAREQAAIDAERQQRADQQAQLATEAAAKQQQAIIDGINDSIKIATEQLKVVQDQLHTQEQAVNATKQVVDALKTFGQSLLTGPLSALSPLNQLNAAKSQMETLFQQAKGGDATAAGQFPQAAQTYLELARAYFASAPGYADAFAHTQSETTQLSDQFGQQLDVQQQILNTLQNSNDKLSAQIALLQKQLETAQGSRTDQLLMEANSLGTRLTQSDAQRIGAELAKLGFSLLEDVMQLPGGGAAPGGHFSLTKFEGANYGTDANGNPNGPGYNDPNTGDFIPQYAAGGDHRGGMRLVGEYGPELETTGPSRITSTGVLLSAMQSSSRSGEQMVQGLDRLDSRLQSMSAATNYAYTEVLKRLASLEARVGEGTKATRLSADAIQARA